MTTDKTVQVGSDKENCPITYFTLFCEVTVRIMFMVGLPLCVYVCALACPLCVYVRTALAPVCVGLPLCVCARLLPPCVCICAALLSLCVRART